MALDEVELVHAYGGVHMSLTYEDAVDTCNWFSEEDQEHGKVGLARIANDCFELVAFGDSAKYGDIRVDSDYVTLEVGRRLYEDGHVDAMCLYGGPYDEMPTDEATIAAMRREQVYGEKAP